MTEPAELTPRPVELDRAEPGGTPVRPGRAGRGRRWLVVIVIGAVLVAGMVARRLPQGAAGHTRPVATPSTPVFAVPHRLLLPAVEGGFEVQQYFGSDGNPPGPFRSCGVDAMPAAGDLLADSGVAFAAPVVPPAASQLVLQELITERIMLYRPDSALVGLRDEVPLAIAGACHDFFAAVSRDFAGELSLLVSDNSPVADFGTPPQVRYDAFVVTGDYLILLTFALDPGRQGGPDVQSALGFAVRVAVAAVDRVSHCTDPVDC